MLPGARTPEGLRLYAIGDVHGRTDLLVGMHQRIASDLDRRPVDDWRVIHLGDYIDRGPDSAGVLALLLEYQDQHHAEFLAGNHDLFLIDFLADPEGADFDLWMDNGGAKTLDSFGIDGRAAAFTNNERSRRRICNQMTEAMPQGLTGFLDNLSLLLIYGDYAFVHAGISPGVPLEEQSTKDLTWIREPFLSSKIDHGAVVVHGHTPVEAVEVRPNRIGIDTGAVFTGNLTCLVLEGAERALLGADGPALLGAPFSDC
jgi:serine/threonine protein phosphatase 1